MTTTIQPATGAGVLYTQQGVGTTPGYSALDDRRAALNTLIEGVFGTATAVTAGGVGGVTQADFLVTQRNAGANMSVDVNMPANGQAWVQGDTINGQGLYAVPVHGSNINEVIAGSDPTNPRIDQVILEVQDNVLDASGGNQARTRVLTGTPTGGATLVNRTGAAALPGSAFLLADILVPATSTSVPTSNTNDRRTYARGQKVWQAMTLNSGATAIAGAYVPAARVVIDRVELRGRLNPVAIPGTSPATLPSSAFAPASSVKVSAWCVNAGVAVTIAAGATAIVMSNAPGAEVSFDGLWYSLT